MKAILWKWMGMLALVIAMVLALTPSPAKEMPLEAAKPAPTEQPGYTVMLNRYAADDWNGGYGHYDLSFLAPQGRAFRIKLGEAYAQCSEITLSYGATNGDFSPARVHLYTAARNDHLPMERLVIYERLAHEDFNTFMAWFAGTFAAYAREADDHHVFSVREEAYAVYSLAEDRNCLSAAIHMALAIPGIGDAQKNPCASLVERLEVSLG